ncbi:MAG TPA: TonB-dependent receptor, partial [Vicinamibacteria bacterium]|nr:TonB-dependent receptor [Vicinamibacteria bacterium]
MKLRFQFGALGVLLLGGTTALAQVVTTGTIVVLAESEDGNRLPGAAVTATATDTTTRREAVTDAQGQATLVNLEPSAQYVVTVSLTGFKSVKNERILVRSGQATTLRVSLSISTVTEEITVVGESPLVDTSNATQGQDITLELTESLPTGRSYQSYLQLVPGVLPATSPTAGENPASKSGLNYADIDGEAGISRDNFYYIDGINVTDSISGTFGANLNTEVIQEQKVLTGGIPAEFVGAPGLLSNVVTKSGSNTFHGSVNYFFQNDSLVEENKNAPEQKFSTFDTAFTLGGPIVKDQLWFFGSYRRLERDDDVTTLDTNQFLRSVNNSQDQWYGKSSWRPTSNDTLSFTYLSDPTTISGRRERDITNALDRSREQGGRRYKVEYSRILGSALVDLGWSRHRGEVSDFSVIREERTTVGFRAADVRTLADEQLGGFGLDTIDERGTELFRGALQWNLDRHTLKVGAEYLKNTDFLNSLTIGDTKSQYASLANHLAGTSAGAIRPGSDFTNVRFSPVNPSDYAGFITTVDSLPNRASFYAAFDLDGDGTISQSELGSALIYNSTAGNPHGRINYDRTFQSQDGPQDFLSKGLSFFAQDTARFGRLAVNAGLRVERFEHFNTLGESIYTFPWTWAPRVSAVYDIMGNGRQKVSAYYGRYYDPIRQNMTQFAGSHSGRTRLEQVFANGEWVTYRVRGGASLDAIFSPVTKTPYTDDLQFNYQIDLGSSMTFDVLYTKRWTRDILEDYDPGIYTNPASYPGPLDHP